MIELMLHLTLVKALILVILLHKHHCPVSQGHMKKLTWLSYLLHIQVNHDIQIMYMHSHITVMS